MVLLFLFLGILEEYEYNNEDFSLKF